MQDHTTPSGQKAMPLEDYPVEAPRAEAEVHQTFKEPQPTPQPAVKPTPQARYGFDIPMPGPNVGAPHWADIPPGMKFPRGRQVMFVRFRSRMTDSPWKGSPMVDEKGELIQEAARVDENGEPVLEPVLWRQCIMWSLSVGDKKLAIGRSQGDSERFHDEQTMQMIRAVDGERVDWSMAGVIDTFWGELGPKYRGALNRICTRWHTLSTEEAADFLVNCIAVRSTGT